MKITIRFVLRDCQESAGRRARRPQKAEGAGQVVKEGKFGGRHTQKGEGRELGLEIDPHLVFYSSPSAS